MQQSRADGEQAAEIILGSPAGPAAFSLNLSTMNTPELLNSYLVLSGACGGLVATLSHYVGRGRTSRLTALGLGLLVGSAAAGMQNSVVLLAMG